MNAQTWISRWGCLVVLLLLGCSSHHAGPPPVPAPTISSFTATPASISAGQSSTLAWTVLGATSLSLDQGVGTVTGTSTIVNPTATTTYTLTATNTSGSISAQATVTVTAASGKPVISYVPSTFTATVGTAMPSLSPTNTGGAATSWSVAPTLPAGLSLSATTGQISGTPTAASASTSYTVTASNAAGIGTAPLVLAVSTSAVAGSAALGSVPALLPARLSVGLMEDPGETWMKTSGVPWDMRYHYFTMGWRNNWGWDATNSGQWGLAFMKECDALNAIPVVQYYCMNDEPGGGEAQFYSKTQNATTMASYFDDFKVLMQRCKEFGKPVLVLMEGDGFAYMEIQSGDNPNAPSAIASTGMAELQGLPNTAAGWGLAFLQIRKSVGATNVVLGMHISDWATQKDIGYVSVTDPLQPEVDKAYAFLSQLGLAANVTGQTFDVLVGDPLDRDSDYYRISQGVDRWWDASDSAPIASKSFNRYAEWLRLWNVKAQKRWVLWQIPLGNSNHLNVPNTGQPREGYKDNRPEYFFGGDDTHLRKFADAGVIGLLFGAGATGQSMYQNDLYSDGQPFMKNHAGAFLKAGGLPIAR